MPRPKRQHYVPRFYLENFTDSNRRIWNYEKGSGEISSLSVNDTAVEKNFYSFKLYDEYDDQIEKWLSFIEGKASKVFDRVINGDPLKGKDRADFSIFLAAQYVRSPSFLRTFAEMKGKMFDSATRSIISDENFLDEDIHFENGVDPDVLDFIKTMNDEDSYVVHVSRESALHGITTANKIAPIIYDMTWHTINSSFGGIITGDSPVVRVADPSTISSVYGDGGFSNISNLITFPLSPNRCLEITWAPTPEGKIIEADRERVKLYNRQRAMFSERRIYSNYRSSGLSKLAKKYPDCSHGIDFSNDSSLAKVVVKRRLSE